MPKGKSWLDTMKSAPQRISMRPQLFLLLSFFFLLIQPSHALILVGTGNKPVSNPGWPANTLEVANQKSRIGWWEGPPFGGGGANVETNGTYLFVGVHPGEYHVSASPAGKKVSAKVEPGETAEALIQLP
jgi:hypothetical protein